MSHRKIYNCIIAVSLVFAAGWILLGCNSSKTTHGEKTADSMAKVQSPAPESEKGSAQLWSENCGRCHNLKTPSSYSDAEWQVAMHHMRVRADLTGEEHRRILAFLEASN
jgi:hypothetical protein